MVDGPKSQISVTGPISSNINTKTAHGPLHAHIPVAVTRDLRVFTGQGVWHSTVLPLATPRSNDIFLVHR